MLSKPTPLTPCPRSVCPGVGLETPCRAGGSEPILHQTPARFFFRVALYPLTPPGRPPYPQGTWSVRHIGGPARFYPHSRTAADPPLSSVSAARMVGKVLRFNAPRASLSVVGLALLWLLWLMRQAPPLCYLDALGRPDGENAFPKSRPSSCPRAGVVRHRAW
jgi:hypothetical protein